MQGPSEHLVWKLKGWWEREGVQRRAGCLESSGGLVLGALDTGSVQTPSGCCPGPLAHSAVMPSGFGKALLGDRPAGHNDTQQMSQWIT